MTTSTAVPTSEVHDAILNRRPGQYQTTCPAHDDNSPSLAVTVDDDGKTLLHCFAGCSSEAIIAAWDLSWPDLFPERPDGKPYRPGPKFDPSSPVPEATDYDPGGKFFDDKFGPKKPVATSRGWPAHDLQRDVNLMFAAFADDVDELPDDAVNVLLMRVIRQMWSSRFEILISTHAAGLILRHMKPKHPHGAWGAWLEEHGIQRNWAADAMRVAQHSWEDIEDDNLRSVDAVLRLTRKKRIGPTKAETEIEGKDRTIAALIVQVDEARLVNPTAEDKDNKIAALKRELQVTKNHNLELVRDVRRRDERIAKLEASNEVMKKQMYGVLDVTDNVSNDNTTKDDPGNQMYESIQLPDGAETDAKLANGAGGGDYWEEHDAGSMYSDDDFTQEE